MDLDIHKIEETLNHLKGEEYISESTVNFFRDIIRVQYKIKGQLHEIDILCSLTDDEVKEKMQKGKTLISWDNMPLKETLLKELFREICEIMKRQEDSESEEIQRLIDAESSDELELETLIKKLFFHDSVYFHSISKNLKIGEDLLLFVAIHLARPFFEAVAERIKDKIADKVADKVVGNLWLKHYCHVCGSSAQMAKLEKETGKRILYCLLCGSEWVFMRIKCPFCCSEEQKSLRFLEEETGPYRIDLCETCKRYIKTLDERKGGGDKRSYIPSVEDIATMYLDILAEKEGYKRSWFFPPSVDDLRAGGESKTHH